MIIASGREIRTPDLPRFAWSGLQRFQNVDYVEEQIVHIHNLGTKQRSNARKQATQIRYCLIQAREYFNAATAVSLATKPNLLYYSIMSLALAEILLKQTGLSSLDKARAEHRHHGLTLHTQLTGSNDLSVAASALGAFPLVINGNRSGTFDLWHRSCRELPITGEVLTVGTGAERMNHELIFIPADQRLSLIPNSGISLLDCLRSLPGMLDYLSLNALIPRILRGKVTKRVTIQPDSQTTTIILHPASQGLEDEFLNNFTCHPSIVNHMTFAGFPSGGIITSIRNSITGTIPFSIPHASMWTANEVRFWPGPQPVNEFGYLYLALFITGNYCRYFPDRWLRDVQTGSPLALAVEEMLFVAERRMALLTLSELSRTYFVPSE